ncbi:fl(2)d-associated complex component isoform X2 [Apis mellifera]|uniref:Fl(2)d-associated complex component isoform X2 n=1 Tax=Apis mellifera TaxID=7460 RepID=A0A7M7IKC7_APIME|nr:fl(2)d-associated complex component isoform X2 [Apis mellifera]|eukprot:XP_016771731.1 fl(2)d-associated complex component isoform X2 [Apis mellifera]
MPVVPAEGAGQLEDLDEPPEPRVRGGSGRASLMKPLVVLALPGMYLFYKYSQYRREQRELSRRRVTERELQHLHHKIDKLLTKLEKNEPELASSQEDECVICVNARATMQTAPCGHRVVCRRCFVKTIQMAVSQRLLPLRCVICRAKILRLKQTLIPRDYSMSGKSWVLPQSASEYNMGTGVPVGVTGPGGRWVAGSVPASASLYSMASGSSSISGVSSVSSSSSSSASSTASSNLGKPTRVRQPSGATLRRSQTQSMKMRIQVAEEEEVMRENRRLPPIKEFQRDYRAGKASTRIRCAQKIVTQLEASPSPRDSSNVSSSTSSSTTKSTSKRPQSAPKLSVVQEIQKSKKEKEREKEREKAEKARQKEEEKAEKTRQKEAKKLAKEEKKRAKKEAKARRKEAEESLLREEK